MEYGRATIVDDLASLELQEPGEAAAAIYDRAIGLRLLYEDRDSGEEHYLIRYPAGTKGRMHRHTAAHAVVVLEGRLQANDQVIGPGAYAHFHGGGPDETPGCGWEGLPVRHDVSRPVDVQILGD